jgi:hypothetical protein
MAKAWKARSNTIGGRIVGFAFFGLFFVIGVTVSWFLAVRPLQRILEARDWPAVECTILSSHVETHDGDDGDTYSVAISYRYEVGGRTYTSDRYKFMAGSSSGYAGKAEVVAQHPPGSVTVCYVNPDDPTDTVLERGFTADLAFGAIPLVFVLVGAGGMIAMARGRKARSDGLPSTPTGLATMDAAALTPAATGPVILKPRHSRGAKAGALLLAALFWNGIVSVFVVQAATGWARGDPDWFLTLFLIPFVLIGAGLIAGIGYNVLAAFNPRPRLELSAGAVPLGGEVRVRWEFGGRVQRLRRFRLHVEGREEATYRRGTDTVTDKSVFARIELVDTADPRAMQTGEVTLRVPAGAMHSFEARNNKIVWELRLHGGIPRWPDLNDDFPLIVLPHANNTSSNSNP